MQGEWATSPSALGHAIMASILHVENVTPGRNAKATAVLNVSLNLTEFDWRLTQ